jgi:hypothetical protein
MTSLARRVRALLPAVSGLAAGAALAAAIGLDRSLRW